MLITVGANAKADRCSAPLISSCSTFWIFPESRGLFLTKITRGSLRGSMKSFPVITDGHSRAARRVLVLKEELHSNRTPSASRVCVACMLDVRAEGGTGDTEDGDGDRDHTTSARGGRAKRRRRRKLYRKTAYRITRLGRSLGRGRSVGRSIGMASRFGLRSPMRCRRHHGMTRPPLTYRGYPCDTQCG